MCEALHSKLFISIHMCRCPSISKSKLLYTGKKTLEDGRTIIRVMPNIASGIRKSMTVIATSALVLLIEASVLLSEYSR